MFLEVLSLDSLILYFQSIHNNMYIYMFELKGVQIENVQCMLLQNSANESKNFNQSKLCYSYILSLPLYNQAMQLFGIATHSLLF